MFRTILWSAFVALILTGCSSSPSGVPSETQIKAKELYEALKRDSQKKLESLDEQLAVWKQKAAKATGETRTALEKRYNELKVRRDEFANQVTELGKSTGNAWEKVKEGLDKSGTALSEAFKKAADEFK